MTSPEPASSKSPVIERVMMTALVIAMLLAAALLGSTVWFAWNRFTGSPPEPTAAAGTPRAAMASTPAIELPAATDPPAEAAPDAKAIGGVEITSTPFLPSTAKPTADIEEAPSTPQVETRLAEDGRYRVAAGESLQQAAAALGVTDEQLRAANAMYGDALLPGQKLIVPAPGETGAVLWRYASLDKDQSAVNYPLWIDAGRFRLHYMPGTLPAADPQALAAMMERGITHVEKTFDMPLPGSFDVYAAGTLYEPPNRYLRGRSFSLDRKVFFLHDGSGDAINQQYLAAHEMTHMYAWNQWGQPFSFLLSEGAAVYAGMRMIEGSDYLPIRAFCAVYSQQGRLPVLFDKNGIESWRGHNNNLVNYYSGGCLVGYLIETYGVEKFGRIYHTQDFPLVYGKELEQLEWEWKASISKEDLPAGLDGGRFVTAVDRFMTSNQVFFDAFSPTPAALEAYRTLDQARIAILSAELDRFDTKMQEFEALFQP